MIKSIEITNLRGIKEGKLENLAPLTVIVGPNNSGKSTILDAILIAASPNPQHGLGRGLGRRQVADPYAWLLRRNGRSALIEGSLAVTDEQSNERRLYLEAHLSQQFNVGTTFNVGEVITELPPPGVSRAIRKIKGSIGQFRPFPNVSEVSLVDPDFSFHRIELAQLYTRVVQGGLRNQAIDIVKTLMPSVEDIQILAETRQGAGDQRPVVNLVFRGGAHPVELAGDGIRLLLAMSFELATLSGGIVLLEEPESHLHPAGIRQAARAILAAMRRGIQIIMSTHSLDMIDAVLADAQESELDKLAVFSVKLDNGILQSSRHSGLEASFARTQLESDLR